MGPNKKDIIIDLNKKHHRTFARSTHNHLKLFLFIGQIFAIFPLSGLLHNNGRLVQFKWISWCTFYTFSYLGGLLFIITFQIYDITCVTELKFGYFGKRQCNKYFQIFIIYFSNSSILFMFFPYYYIIYRSS